MSQVDLVCKTPLPCILVHSFPFLLSSQLPPNSTCNCHVRHLTPLGLCYKKDAGSDFWSPEVIHIQRDQDDAFLCLCFCARWWVVFLHILVYIHVFKRKKLFSTSALFTHLSLLVSGCASGDTEKRIVGGVSCKEDRQYHVQIDSVQTWPAEALWLTPAGSSRLLIVPNGKKLQLLLSHFTNEREWCLKLVCHQEHEVKVKWKSKIKQND